MAILDDVLDNLFQVPGDDGVGIVLKREDGGRRLDIRDLQRDLSQLRRCRAYVLAVDEFARWITHPDANIEVGASRETMNALANALRRDNRAEAAQLLDRLVNDLNLLSFLSDTHEARLRFEFVAAYHENPTWIGVIALGVTFPLTLLALTLSTVQIRQSYSEAECVERANDMTHRQMVMVEAMHRREGRMTPQLEATLKTIVQAGQVAAGRCGSTLRGIEVNVTIPPGIHFEFRIGGDVDELGP